jgi:hypothetical protein
MTRSLHSNSTVAPRSPTANRMRLCRWRGARPAPLRGQSEPQRADTQDDLGYIIDDASNDPISIHSSVSAPMGFAMTSVSRSKGAALTGGGTTNAGGGSDGGAGVCTTPMDARRAEDRCTIVKPDGERGGLPGRLRCPERPGIRTFHAGPWHRRTDSRRRMGAPTPSSTSVEERARTVF